jgi:hypothetical protein
LIQIKRNTGLLLLLFGVDLDQDHPERELTLRDIARFGITPLALNSRSAGAACVAAGFLFESSYLKTQAGQPLRRCGVFSRTSLTRNW